MSHSEGKVPIFLVALQRLGAQAVVNGYLVSSVLGPSNATDPGVIHNGHHKFAEVLVGEFEKVVQTGDVQRELNENCENDNGDFDKRICVYTAVTSSLPVIITSAAGLPTKTEQNIPDSAKMLFLSSKAFYAHLNDEAAPMSEAIFSSVFREALLSQNTDGGVTTKSTEFTQRLSAGLKAAQLKIQPEDPDIEVPWRHLCPIIHLILHHYPSAFVVQTCVKVGVAAIQRRHDETELQSIRSLIRSTQALEVNKGPLLTAAPRAKSAREIFAEQQSSMAGDETDTPGTAVNEVTTEEAFEIEVSEAVPTFLKDVAQKSALNFRKAPVNLAEQREMEARKAGKAAPSAPRVSLASIAENQEKTNTERNKTRAIERKRQETQKESDDPLKVAAEFNKAAEDEESRAFTGELESNEVEAGTEGGIKGVKDVLKLPPWLRAAASSGDGQVKFGYQTTKSMEEQRKSLPVYASRDKIIEYVRNHSVTILQGETGSGKTTQIPQYLCDAGFTKKISDRADTSTGMRQRDEFMIAVTQPRRVAAVELAKRVAKERGTRCGDEVGYTVRFDDQTSPLTKIKYMTDGMLLREALLDDQFMRYSVVILDEAHERSINTDVLFGVLKKAITKRPSLKIIITSATIELDRFCAYFGVNERFQIEGRTFPVEMNYLPTVCEDYVTKSVETAIDIHLNDRSLRGDILIFLTGQDEIDAAMDRIHARFEEEKAKAKKSLPADAQPFELLILPCYATLPGEAMSKVFERTPPNCRKIVLSTNVAETSITIDGLSFVIDSGFCKQHVYDPKHKVEQLKIVPVSQAQATQRAGRAGRTNAGTCHRLFTKEQFESEMVPATVPEIQRTNLVNIVLTLKAVGIDDLLEFDFLDPPPKETLVNALQTLRYLGALDDDGLLTPLGQRMSTLPLRPTESKTLLTSIDLGCAPTVMTIVSMMDRRSVFFRPRDRHNEADAAKMQFLHEDGDQLMLANVFNLWVDSGMSDTWCRTNFVNPRAMVEANKTREQLRNMLSQRHDITKDSRDSVLIRKALTSGYFFQVAKRGNDNTYVTMAERREVAMHPSSVLFSQSPEYVVYHELYMTTREYMREVMRVDPRWLVELAPAFYSKPKHGELTKEQKAQRLNPTLRPWEAGNSWRISKLKKRT